MRQSVLNELDKAVKLYIQASAFSVIPNYDKMGRYEYIVGILNAVGLTEQDNLDLYKLHDSGKNISLYEAGRLIKTWCKEAIG